MELEQNKALVRRYYDEVLTGRDRQLLEQLLDATFVSHVSGGPDVTVDIYIAAVDATLAAFADLEVKVDDQIAENDKVATRWRATGTHTGSFAGVAASGRLITVTGIHVHRVARGRLVEHWEELNLLGALRQMRAAG
ncbi:MAG: ester cyclase [Solirubrobacterales bacterium]|nr:ester cyclase [Solirubrobacterales bacterium]